MTKEEAKKFGLQLLQGIMERNESYPVYANNVKQAIDALSEPNGSSEIPKDLDAYAQSVEDYYDVGEERGYLCVHRGEVKDAVIAGAKWQEKRNLRFVKQVLSGDFTVFEAGRKYERKQMMKEAVEGEVYLYSSYKREAVAILVDIPKDKLGDKVRIIIVKED